MKLRIHSILRLLAACALLCMAALPVCAAESVGGAEYCFSTEDFLNAPSPADGVYLRSLPDETLGVLRLGSRTLRSGDVLPAEDLNSVVFSPAGACDARACVSYSPIWGDKLGEDAVLTVRLRSGENQPPVARDVRLETYRNLEKAGRLDAEDPEGGLLTYRIVQTPKRGTLRIEDDGTFVYTPKPRKVGDDCFTYTVCDPSGAESEEATVSITILKPMDRATYADMRGDSAEFEALWLRSSGLLAGGEVSGHLCFRPEQTVTRGEFLAMAMDLANIAPDYFAEAAFCDSDAAPLWMRGYLCSAQRRGIVQGVRRPEGLCFCPHAPVTRAEAAVMARNILDLDPPDSSSVFADDAVPAWAGPSVAALARAGIPLRGAADAPLTRRDAACMLYRMSKLL